jgi:N-acetylglutamate synthase-like GNAT family acetyltransferase
MSLQIRQMQHHDVEQLLKLYQRFVLQYVGSATRTLKTYERMTRRKDDLRWVASDVHGEIIGYVNATYAKGRRQGRIHEIIVDPEQDFTAVAGLLAERVHKILVEKGAASIQAASIRNPHYPQIFPKLGFFEVETDGVFMYAITDAAKFLVDISPIIVRRLNQVRNWNGLLQISCEENNAFFKKDGETIQSILDTNCVVDCNISLTRKTLSNILLGVVDAQKAWAEGTVTVKATLKDEAISKLLSVVFPKRQFLALDYW